MEIHLPRNRTLRFGLIFEALLKLRWRSVSAMTSIFLRTILKGLVEAAKLSTGNSNNIISSEVLQMLSQTKESIDKSNAIQERIETNLETASAVQNKLLAFLESKMVK